MANYNISEGNQIGYLPSEFGESGNSMIEKKLVASADITKGQVVIVTGNLTVGPATAGSTAVLGVAMFDAKSGSPVAIETEGLFKLVAAAGITGGAQVEAGAAGTVQTVSTGKVIGLAISTALTGEGVYVKFSI